MSTLITQPRSVIPACDVPETEKLYDIISGTRDVEGIGAYKVGSILGLSHGLSLVCKIIRGACNKPIIYDHQKGGTDIPDLGSQFARILKLLGVDAAILFPFGGTATEEAWIKALQDQELHVLVGSEMTQSGFLAHDSGFIADDAPLRMFEIAIKHNVHDFVVPGNKPESVMSYRTFFERTLGSGEFTLYAPGFITQGGDISETGEAAGDNWHAIVGSALYTQSDIESIHQKALELTAQL